MDITKIKSIFFSIDPKVMKEKAQLVQSQSCRAIKTMDIKSLFIGFMGLAVFYSLIFIYVSLNSEATLKQIKNQIPTETVNIHIVKQHRNNSHGALAQPKKHVMATHTQIIKRLHQKTDEGILPIISKPDNLTSFRAYQHQFEFNTVKKPVISFIVMDYGLSKKQSETALDVLPPEVSMALSPYASLPNEWISMAQDKGHEVWLGMPIQNKKYADSGDKAIFHHASLVKKQIKMRAALASAQGYVGVASYTDEGVEETNKHYLSLANELYTRGLGFFEINPEAPPTIEKKALSMGAPYIKSNLELLKITGEHNSFEALEALAQKNGKAIAVIPNYPDVIKNLAVWIMKVGRVDYIIAPVSAIYDLPLYQNKTKTSGKNQKEPDHLRLNDHTEPKETHH